MAGDGPGIEVFALGPFATNCYLVRGAGTTACIVDAGMGPEVLIDKARDAERTGLTIDKIILTHAHVDHMAGLDEVRGAFPAARVLQHRAESAWLRDPELNLSGGYGVPITARDADELLEGGEELDLDGLMWKVLFVPGHSPGSIALHCAQANVLIAGDTLFNGSIGRYDFPTSDGELLMKSIREVIYRLPDETVVLAGHGPATTVGREKKSNPFVRG